MKSMRRDVAVGRTSSRGNSVGRPDDRTSSDSAYGPEGSERRRATMQSRCHAEPPVGSYSSPKRSVSTGSSYQRTNAATTAMNSRA